jgi:septum formation protein
VIVSGVDESMVEATNPTVLCATLARMKAEGVVTRLRQHPRGAGAAPLVLGCDSVLAFDGEILGKPSDDAEGVKRWQRMRGQSGVLHTGHCLIDVDDGARAEAVASTTVRFADVSDAEVEAYVRTGEPLHVAGAFTIDGLGGWFVESVDGDPGTVVGLSLPLLRHLLRELGVSVLDLWPPDLAARI